MSSKYGSQFAEESGQIPNGEVTAALVSAATRHDVWIQQEWGSSMAKPDDKQRTREAQARLDQMRQEAGGALTGEELRTRAGINAPDAPEDPPLDWRMTPKNVAIQAVVVAIFLAVLWFLLTAFFGGFGEVLNR